MGMQSSKIDRLKSQVTPGGLYYTGPNPAAEKELAEAEKQYAAYEKQLKANEAYRKELIGVANTSVWDSANQGIKASEKNFSKDFGKTFMTSALLGPEMAAYSKKQGETPRDIGDYLSLGYKSSMEDEEKKAAQVEAGAQKKSEEQAAVEEEKRQADAAPFKASGEAAVQSLRDKVMAGPGEFEPGPRYLERYKTQVEDPVLARASAGGYLGGGAAVKKLRRASMDFASQEHDNWLNRYYASLAPLQSLSGMGQTVTGQASSSAIANANMMGQNAMYSGQIAADRANAEGMQQQQQYNMLGDAATTIGSIFASNNNNSESVDTTGGWEDTNYYNSSGTGGGGGATSDWSELGR